MSWAVIYKKGDKDGWLTGRDRKEESFDISFNCSSKASWIAKKVCFNGTEIVWMQARGKCKMLACIISKMAFVKEENNTIFHCLWSLCSRSVLNHLISLLGWIVDRANRLGAVGDNLSAGMSTPPLLYFHPHISSTHTAAVASQSLPFFLSFALTCVTLHVLLWRSLMLPPTPCVSSLPVGSDSWLMMMQASCRRHRLPWEEGLFLPVGTKYTKLSNIFMEAHLISACLETSLPTLSHLSLSIHLSYQKCCSSTGTFFTSSWHDRTCEGFD